jgi:polysaccharide export outer membrane protein
LIYLQGEEITKTEFKSYTPFFKIDDFLNITVFGSDENSVKPFNLPNISSPSNRGYSIGAPSSIGYLIDENGNIEFPILGKIKLAGLTRIQATELLKEKLKVYISNPIVNIQILNFKITVLGEVKNPGTFTIPNERITLFEAIGLAGDLNITGVRKNVLVIREENGVKKEYRVNLNSKTALNSPVYYLNQNDLVYVEPNQAKSNSALISSASGVFISVASLLITMINVLTK